MTFAYGSHTLGSIRKEGRERIEIVNKGDILLLYRWKSEGWPWKPGNDQVMICKMGGMKAQARTLDGHPSTDPTADGSKMFRQVKRGQLLRTRSVCFL